MTRFIEPADHARRGVVFVSGQTSVVPKSTRVREAMTPRVDDQTEKQSGLSALDNRVL